MRFEEIFHRVRRSFPEVEFGLCKNLANEGLEEIARERPSVKYTRFNVAENQRWYNIGDDNSDLRIDKIEAVAIMDSDGNYRKIPRLVDGNNITNLDIK